MTDQSPTQSQMSTGEQIRSLLRAAAEGDAATVQNLIRTNPSLVDAKGAHPYWGGEPQALQLAAEWGRLEIAALLIDAGADIEAAGSAYGRWTPLHCALNQGHGPAQYDAIAQLLIERGAVVDIWAAVRMGDVARVDAMLRDDPNILHARGPSEGTPLHFARTVEMAQLLLARGAAPQARDCYGHTPLQCAAAAGVRANSVARYLMDATGESSIALACAVGHVDRVRALLDADPSLVHASINSDEMHVGHGLPDGDSLLHVAASCGHSGIAELLIERRANVNAASNKGQRPLHFAAGNGHIDVARILLEHGADVDARESEHDGTPFDWAQFHGQVAMARFLRRYASDRAAEGGSISSKPENPA
jgi:ankyrin repeat protein